MSKGAEFGQYIFSNPQFKKHSEDSMGGIETT